MPMAATKIWTLEELHSLPDDGNKYELVHGELFVTPAPTVDHETILARLNRLLEPYVAAHHLGYLYRPRAVVQHKGSEVEPDMMVRQPPAPKSSWDAAPVPILVVETLSRSTRRRDREEKREFYLEVGVADYWIVDPDQRTITSVRHDRGDVVAGDTLTWRPAGASAPLVVDVARVFADDQG
jgi:Uma2 family endonuclease